MNECYDEKCTKKLGWILAIIGFVAVVAGIAYAVYRYCTPDYLDEFEELDEDVLEGDDTPVETVEEPAAEEVAPEATEAE